MAVITKIKLTGENHQDVDMVCGQIKAICDETGVDLTVQYHSQLANW